MLRTSPQRTAYTLTELLVVIAIIMLIATLAAASLLNDSGETQIREASRIITSFLQKAQAMALKEGKPVGVMIERYYDQSTGRYLPSASQKLYLVAQSEDSIIRPDFRESKAFINSSGELISLGLSRSDPNDPSTAPANWDISWRGRVFPGDLLVLNGGQHVYEIVASSAQITDPQTGRVYINPDQPPGNTPWELNLVRGSIPSGTRGYSYYIQSANPFVPRSSSDSIELPAGVCIDMDGSGVGNAFPTFQGTYYEGAGTDFTPADLAGGSPDDWFYFAPALILFGPDGTVDSVHGSVGLALYRYDQGQFNDQQPNMSTPAFTDVKTEHGFSPDADLSEAERKLASLRITNPKDGYSVSVENPPTTYLLIGKFEQAGLNPADLETRHNWQDQTSLWVSIRGLTGEIRSSPVSPLPDTPALNRNNMPWYQQIQFSRQYALQEQGLIGGAGE